MQKRFAHTLLKWFQQHGRHDLPWQHPRTAYRVWLSEIMLQQTQVRVVIPYFNAFTRSFPSIPALARATEDAVMHHWAGLGYYARARNLHRTAQLCVQHHAGRLPRQFDALLALPGIGKSTAGAILAQTYNIRVPILDANVKRVLCRFHGIVGYPGQSDVEKQLWDLAWQHITDPPTQDIANYTQALMDLGATLCTSRQPECTRCPLKTQCVAFQTNKVTQLPTAKARKILQTRTAVAVIIFDLQGNILLQRRPSSGIWGGLWTLPQAETKHALDALCLQTLYIDIHTAKSLSTIHHQFSHYRLELTIYTLQLTTPTTHVFSHSSGLAWIGAQNYATIGLPAPIHKLLSDFLQRITVSDTQHA